MLLILFSAGFPTDLTILTQCHVLKYQLFMSVKSWDFVFCQDQSSVKFYLWKVIKFERSKSVRTLCYGKSLFIRDGLLLSLRNRNKYMLVTWTFVDYLSIHYSSALTFARQVAFTKYEGGDMTWFPIKIFFFWHMKEQPSVLELVWHLKYRKELISI